MDQINVLVPLSSVIPPPADVESPPTKAGNLQKKIIFLETWVNVGPRGTATMVPDIGNTSSWGIDGNIDGFKASNSCAESQRNISDPVYTIVLDKEYPVSILRTVRVWNRFDLSAITYNFPFGVKLLDVNVRIFCKFNFFFRTTLCTPKISQKTSRQQILLI